MAGFSAIQTYGSDSEDDEAANEAREIGETTGKLRGSDQPPRLPLPESILKFKGVPHHEEVVDNPADHEGRTRSFKHERGNWATHVYAKYEPPSSVRLWMKRISSELPVTTLPEFHISFSRTVALKFHWIESFVESLKKLFLETNRFEVELQDIKVYLNDDKNRTFVAIRCTGVDDSPKKLVESLNELLAEYQLPAYYEDASFHISFLSSIDNLEALLEPFEKAFSEELAIMLTQTPSGSRVMIDRLYCKIGNKLYEFRLK